MEATLRREKMGVVWMFEEEDEDDNLAAIGDWWR